MERVEISDSYLSGFGNHFSTEAIVGALPLGQNTPQAVPLGLYAEQLSGTAFTAPRHENLRTWFYRIRPSVLHNAFQKISDFGWTAWPFNEEPVSPNQYRWNPLPEPKTDCDFVEGIVTIAGNGGPGKGSAVHLYQISHSMEKRFFYDADGELLLVPQEGGLHLKTEHGFLNLVPGEIGVIPRGVKFQVLLLNKKARGYVCENYGAAFRLPGLGPIGANGLANPRDFLYPTAKYEDKKGSFELVAKFQGHLWSAQIEHSPLDVVAWHGNYAPYKYDLANFQTVSPVSFDHPDPSIFTVLTSPTEQVGTANVDFVIFPPRWLVMEHTFRPPYFHRNCMSEYMGLIRGVYEAKQEGFVPGGGSLHNAMSAHGPDNATYEKSIQGEQKPTYIKDTLAFMFESSQVYRVTPFALKTEALQKNYLDCWKGLKSHFRAK